MNKFLALFIALVSGVLAVVLIYGYVDRTKKNVYEGMEMVPVLVAANAIPSGTVLAAKDVAYREFPEKFLSRRVVHSSEGVTALGAKTVVNIERGTPVYWSDLEDRSVMSSGLAGLLQPGMTTFVMPVNDVTGVANMLMPNQRVDIQYNFDLDWLQKSNQSKTLGEAPQDMDELKVYMMKEALGEQIQGENPAVALLYQNVLILSTDSNLATVTTRNRETSDDETYSTVTLMVTPRQARVLTFCSAKGMLSLSLRREGETSERKDNGIITRDVVLEVLMNTGKHEQMLDENIEADEVSTHE